MRTSRRSPFAMLAAASLFLRGDASGHERAFPIVMHPLFPVDVVQVLLIHDRARVAQAQIH